ncbi:hypothetical protein Back2_20900 [Nocardioides baekrokdamisoli]|uniref:Uncharacterized protein n=1 Tax=Nocardioides baekrokdamisoli TaxID=1804624 RepID=A0A3G9IZH9_9ACTN|nr:hypothetical protein [Nocardioides baekrokdamisoli]BBH17803.1 hypothetical protein Back2_20900 [Nocardioides baekrokdamisoli]
MTRRPTPAVYRRRRLVVALGAVAVVVLLVWLAIAAVSALTGSHSNAAAQASASVSASAEADDTPTISVSSVPAGGRCDAGDIVLRPVAAMAHVNGPVALTVQAFTRQNPECTWRVTHGSVQATISLARTPSFWSTANCPTAVKEQTVTLRQGTPITLTLATWDGQASSQAGGCGQQNPWARPGVYHVQAAALGGNPSSATRLTMVAPGVPLVQPVTSPTASPTPTGTGKAKPKGTAKPTGSPTPTAVQTF